MDVGIDGNVVAYTRRVGTRGVEVVVRDGDRPVVRLAAGRGESPIGVGRDRNGKRVVVYLRCGGACDLVAYSPSAGRSRVVDSDFTERIIAAAPCRIVAADLSRERILPPRIAVFRRTATVLRTTVRNGKVTGRQPQAGVKVEVRDSDEQLVATLTTDAQGKVTLPDDDSAEGLAVTAATTPVGYGYAG